MNESYSKIPKFCKVHKVSNGVALRHIVTHFRITRKGSTPASKWVHSKDRSILPEKQWAVVTTGRPLVRGKPNEVSSARQKALWSPVWTLTLATTCHPAVVTQMSGVKRDCVLWQKVDLLLTKVMHSPEKSHRCTIATTFPLTCYLALPVAAKNLMFVEKEVFSEHLGW